MTENKRFKWEDVYKWEVPAFLKVMNGLHEKNEQLKKENKQLKQRIKELEEENASMKGRIINAMVESNKVECDCRSCVCEDYVNDELKKW